MSDRKKDVKRNALNLNPGTTQWKKHEELPKSQKIVSYIHYFTYIIFNILYVYAHGILIILRTNRRCENNIKQERWGLIIHQFLL